MQYIRQQNVGMDQLPGLVSRAILTGIAHGQRQQQQRQQQENLMDRIQLQDTLTRNRQLETDKRRSFNQMLFKGYTPADVTSSVGPTQPPETAVQGQFGRHWNPPKPSETPEGYNYFSTGVPGQGQFVQKPKPEEQWEDYEDPKFPGVLLQRSTTTGKVRKAVGDTTTEKPGEITFHKVKPDGRVVTTKAKDTPENRRKMQANQWEVGESTKAPSGEDPAKAEDRVFENVMKLYKVGDMASFDPETRGKITQASVRAQELMDGGMGLNRATQQAINEIEGKQSVLKSIPRANTGVFNNVDDTRKAVENALNEASPIEVRDQLEEKGWEPDEIDQNFGDLLKGGGGLEINPNLPSYKTPDDVKAAVKNGEINRQTGIRILREQFNFD